MNIYISLSSPARTLGRLITHERSRPDWVTYQYCLNFSQLPKITLVSYAEERATKTWVCTHTSGSEVGGTFSFCSPSFSFLSFVHLFVAIRWTLPSSRRSYPKLPQKPTTELYSLDIGPVPDLTLPKIPTHPSISISSSEVSVKKKSKPSCQSCPYNPTTQYHQSCNPPSSPHCSRLTALSPSPYILEPCNNQKDIASAGYISSIDGDSAASPSSPPSCPIPSFFPIPPPHRLPFQTTKNPHLTSLPPPSISKIPTRKADRTDRTPGWLSKYSASKRPTARIK